MIRAVRLVDFFLLVVFFVQNFCQIKNGDHHIISNVSVCVCILSYNQKWGIKTQCYRRKKAFVFSALDNQLFFLIIEKFSELYAGLFLFFLESDAMKSSVLAAVLVYLHFARFKIVQLAPYRKLF